MGNRARAPRALGERVGAERSSKRVDPFYRSGEWKKLRHKVLVRDKWTCRMCGVTVPKHAHVDHIQPRSKAPELALSPSNLQVLCEHCHNSIKRCHEHRETVEHNEDGYPVGSDWAAG